MNRDNVGWSGQCWNSGFGKLGPQVHDLLLVFSPELSSLIGSQDSDRSHRSGQNGWGQRSREDESRSIASNGINQVSRSSDVATSISISFACADREVAESDGSYTSSRAKL